MKHLLLDRSETSHTIDCTIDGPEMDEKRLKALFKEFSEANKKIRAFARRYPIYRKEHEQVRKRYRSTIRRWLATSSAWL
jgi:hypothetical protein